MRPVAAGQVWYHGNISRLKAEELLVRAKKTDVSLCGTARALYHGAVHQSRILLDADELLALQTIRGVQEQRFSSLQDLVTQNSFTTDVLVCPLKEPVQQDQSEEDSDDDEDEDRLLSVADLSKSRTETVSQVFQMRLEQLRLSRVDNGFAGQLRQYVQQGLQQDMDTAQELHGNFESFLAKMNAMRQLFDQTTPGKNRKASDAVKDNQGQFKMQELLERLTTCKTVITSLERKASKVLQEFVQPEADSENSTKENFLKGEVAKSPPPSIPPKTFEVRQESLGAMESTVSHPRTLHSVTPWCQKTRAFAFNSEKGGKVSLEKCSVRHTSCKNCSKKETEMKYAGKSPQINWDSANLDEEWKRFKQHAELMFTGPLSKKNEAEKCSFLQIWVGEQGRDICSTWKIEAEEVNKLATYYKKFSDYVKPKKNKILARYKFHTRVQSSAEPIEQFVTDLKVLARDCDFKDQDTQDEMVLDRLVFGTNNENIRLKLIDKGSELKLSDAIDTARTYEVSQSTLKSIQPVAAHEDSHRKKGTNPAWRQTRTGQTEQRNNSCGKCGRDHKASDTCSASGQSCRKCGRRNHFAAVCRSKPTVQEVNCNVEEFHIETVNQKHKVGDQAFVDLRVAEMNKSLRCKLDTGAQVNVLPEKIFQQLKNKYVMKATTRLYGYGNVPLDVRGKCRLTCSFKGRSGDLEFYIVRADATPVLSLKASIVLTVQEAQTAQSILEEYKDVFEGIGQLPGEHWIQLDHSVPPKVHPTRRIPVSLRDPLKAELDRMERLGVIRKVDEPTDWVNSLVVVEKPRTVKLRVCLDPRDLNKAIKREHYQLPALDDIRTRLAGSKYFSVVDARSGYWQVKLDEESSKLTTFNTVYGRYRFTRLAFGVHSAQEVFQKQMDKIFQELEGVEVIVDDILVHGRTEEEHNSRFRAMLQRARDKCVKLNPEKVVVAAPEVGYFGHILTRDGLKPDPKKVDAITSMKAPTNKSGHQMEG
ncbi:hypothetical protein Bbelb_109520 [Branchiostoma belcheri]|nr:hypothetical protein Bbelb_109520 [Branchiostoma belcheri]